MAPGRRITVPWMLAGREVDGASVRIAEDRNLVINGEAVRLRWIEWLSGRYPIFLCPHCFRGAFYLYWNPAGRRSRLACASSLNLCWPVEREAPRRRTVRRAWRTFDRFGKARRRAISDAQLQEAGEVIDQDEARPTIDLAKAMALAAGKIPRD